MGSQDYAIGLPVIQLCFDPDRTDAGRMDGTPQPAAGFDVGGHGPMDDLCICTQSAAASLALASSA